MERERLERRREKCAQCAVLGNHMSEAENLRLVSSAVGVLQRTAKEYFVAIGFICRWRPIAVPEITEV